MVSQTESFSPTKRLEPVLVCDDDPRVRDTIANALTRESIPVETADRGVDAIQKIMQRSYEAVVMDLKMPGLGGLDAISIIKRIDHELPIIVVTGHTSYETERAARAAGIFYYLVKPFPVDELKRAVRAARQFRQEGRR